jgi:hypothetical protein
MRTERKPAPQRPRGAKTFATRDKETTASRMTFQSPNEYRWSPGSTGISSTGCRNKLEYVTRPVTGPKQGLKTKF